MSVYRRYLPEAFPVGVELPRDLVERCVTVLMEPFMGGVDGQELDHGSSFAHTADTWGGALGSRVLWLSRVSLNRLHEQGLLLEVELDPPPLSVYD